MKRTLFKVALWVFLVFLCIHLATTIVFYIEWCRSGVDGPEWAIGGLIYMAFPIGWIMPSLRSGPGIDQYVLDIFVYLLNSATWALVIASIVTIVLRFVLPRNIEVPFPCRSCGYSLIRIKSDRCPECGTKIDETPST